MPFIELEEPDHSCRTPGRTVGFDTTWYCDTCLLIWRWDECEGHEVNGKPVYHDGHWNLTGEVFTRPAVRLVEKHDKSIYHPTEEGWDTLAEMLD